MFYHAESSQRKLPDNASVRLINPAKNELGRLSKFVIQAVNKELRHKVNMSQWKNKRRRHRLVQEYKE